jgi:hypothetical protein
MTAGPEMVQLSSGSLLSVSSTHLSVSKTPNIERKYVSSIIHPILSWSH